MNWLAAGLCAALLPLGAARADVSRDEAAAVERAEAQVRAAQDRLQLVEKEYGQSQDESELLRLRKGFADGETQYLLGEWSNAAALLYDVADGPAYRKEESWPEAVYYLADSLYHLQSWLDARRYYRELLEQGVGKYQQEALVRLIELSDRTSDWTGIDEAYRQLLASGRPLKAEVIYLHAKWLARRPDLADAERISRALEAFRALPDSSDYGPQARYFEGALLVQQGALKDAAERFQRVLQLPEIKDAPTAAKLAEPVKEKPLGEAAVRAERAARCARIRDQTVLALGRIWFEQGRYGPAIDQYRLIEKESEAYGDALYELAASWLKLGEYERALRTVELLLVVIEDAPEAKLLEANLYLKLKQYVKAQKQFEGIADQYRPVEEKIATLVRRDDPVSYYDELLQQQGEKSLDATQLLPEVARRYVAGRDVQHARVIIDELSAGRQGIDESLVILRRLDVAVGEGKLDLFPTLQEGNARAVEVVNSLVRAEAALIDVQAGLAEREAPVSKPALDAARALRAQVEQQLSGALPQTAAESDDRRRALLSKITELDKTASRLGLEVEGITAQLDAALKWQKDTRGQRRAGAQAEREFAAQVKRDRDAAQALEEERQRALRTLDVLRAQAAAVAAGGQQEDALRQQLEAALAKEGAAASQVAGSVEPDSRQLFARIEGTLQQLRAARPRAEKVRALIRDRAALKVAALRKRVEIEHAALQGYEKSVAVLEPGTRQLLGRIAYNSFARVEKQFYDLILKAQVGVVDAAWTQKKERTDAITALENERRAQLKALQDEFSEVLKEVK